mmetsp:Transcript_128427/g.363449  ORF Transcript_128427/g.363449 Transcript_128427/m.363449 type:complete len:136 (+) Transcript_128427:3-410(+)
MFQRRLGELQELYDQRPSREEDLERISALETDVHDKDAVIKKLVDEMQFYKLELVNREQNYNKVFGATPTVGIMNPVATKKNSTTSVAPQMRVVQQPGAQMQMGLPPLGGMGAPVAASANATKRLSKRPSSGQIR